MIEINSGQYLEIDRQSGLILVSKQNLGPQDAPRFAVIDLAGNLIAGPIVQAGNENRKVFFGELWGDLCFGFEYTDRHEENGRYGVWTLKKA